MTGRTARLKGVEDARRIVAGARGQQPETAIRTQVREWLQWRGWFVVLHVQGPLSHKGFPDLTATRDGETVYIEVKTKTGVQRVKQEEFQTEIEAHGARYILARGIEDVEEAMR